MNNKVGRPLLSCVLQSIHIKRVWDCCRIFANETIKGTANKEKEAMNLKESRGTETWLSG